LLRDPFPINQKFEKKMHSPKTKLSGHSIDEIYDVNVGMMSGESQWESRAPASMISGLQNQQNLQIQRGIVTLMTAQELEESAAAAEAASAADAASSGSGSGSFGGSNPNIIIGDKSRNSNCQILNSDLDDIFIPTSRWNSSIF
jgi:hypothetical protein